LEIFEISWKRRDRFEECKGFEAYNSVYGHAWFVFESDDEFEDVWYEFEAHDDFEHS
jgi:hypothetical protein